VIDFEEEIKKFVPAMETSDAEEMIRRHDMTDMSDILRQMVEEMKSANNTKDN